MKKRYLKFCKGPPQGLDDTILTTEAKYLVNFTKSRKRFVLCLHYNGRNIFLFVNATKIYQLKTKDSEIKPNTLCLGNLSNSFTLDKIKKERIKRKCKIFFCQL